MGFGRPFSRAILGEPLRVSVPLRLEAGETLEADCVQVEVHYGESRLSPSQVQVSLVGGSSREATVQVRTTTPITEPIVTYELTAGCQAKINRQFVALADPPGMTPPVSPVTAPVSATTPVLAPQERPSALTSAQADASSQGVVTAPSTRAKSDAAKRTSRTARATPSTRGVTPAPAVRPVTEADASPRTSLSLTPKAAAAVPTAERLVLDPVEADAAARPDLRMSGSLDAVASVGATDEPASPEVQARRAAAAALWQAMNLSPEDIARDRQKLIAQERMLAQLQLQASQPRTDASTSPAQRAQAAAQGEGSWLLYLVGALALVGLGLCVALFMKLRRRQQEEAAWWQSQMQEPQGEAPAAVSPPATLAAAPVVAVPPQAVKAEPPKSDIERASVHAAAAGVPAAAASPRQAPTAVTPPAPPATPARQTVLEATREVSVEELIDLEQQADFFVVLGQDDAALDLLESHVHAVSASPLPFLKLLEIYQRLGKRADYERIQAAFNQRFNAHAPAWDADLQHGHELVDYPGVVERLQTLWPVPAKAMEVLEKSLTHPENEADTFELPAYRELLFLYAVARDLSEREVDERPSVDLLASGLRTHKDPAPFDLTAHEEEVEPLMATRPIKAVPAVQPTLSLDLHLDDLPPADKPRSSYGDVMVSGKGVAANEQDVEHIDLPDLSELDVDLRSSSGAHKP